VYCHLIFSAKLGKLVAGHLEDFQKLKQAKNTERTAAATRQEIFAPR
jgi:hypothetical protein